jgi:hypothetical protein
MSVIIAPFSGALGQMDHPGAVLADHGLFRVVVEGLTEDEDDFAVVVAIRIREGCVRGEGDVPRHLLPQKAKLVAGVPDVIAGRMDGVCIGRGVVAGAAGDNRGAHVRLAVKDADGRVEGGCRAMEVCRRRNLLVGCGAWLRPVGHRWSGKLATSGTSSRKSQGEQGCGTDT